MNAVDPSAQLIVAPPTLAATEQPSLWAMLTLDPPLVREVGSLQPKRSAGLSKIKAVLFI
jgi:hypothetical protein